MKSDPSLIPEPEPDARDQSRATAERRRNLRLGSDIALGSDDVDELEFDELQMFRPALIAVRWSTLIMSLALAIPAVAARDWAVILWCLLLSGYTAARTFFPLRIADGRRGTVTLCLEVSFFTLALLMTGFWESPLVFSILTGVAVAGFARGFWSALRATAFVVVAVGMPYLLTNGTDPGTLRTYGEWTLLTVFVALIAGYARRISGLADYRETLVMDRVGRLADANRLLYSLHRVAQSLPASLDLHVVLDTTVSRLKSLLDADAAALLLFDDTDGHWQVARSMGCRLPERLGPTELPPPLRQSLTDNAVVSASNLLGPEGPGLNARTSSGLYATLEARGTIIGLLAIEHTRADHYQLPDVELMTGFATPVALAIDNARWFSRIHTLGADEERTRIARDLHDRIGQSLAYLAIELDRLARTEEAGGDVATGIDQLRGDVRKVVSEVRETLYDLRTDVDDDTDLATTLERFTARVADRAGLTITCDIRAEGRPPILQEREIWRIAQEALTNVERHADASNVTVSWFSDGSTAILTIVDDGCGFEVGSSGRVDSYGVVGMRERAASIGASLEIKSAAGAGTEVRCELDMTKGPRVLRAPQLATSQETPR